MSRLLIPAAILGLWCATGCQTSSATSKGGPSTAASPPPSSAPGPAAAVARAEPPSALDLAPLLFDLDAHVLEPNAQARLQRLGTYLLATPAAKVRISGHADERGTPEYNLALGDARARAARDYLVRMGIQPSRIHIESRGEEQPAVEGHDEAAWAMNRRDEITLTDG